MSDEEKQVSEVTNLEDAGEPEAPGDATAGDPDSESGGAQEGTAGPNAAPRHDPPERENKSSK